MGEAVRIGSDRTEAPSPLFDALLGRDGHFPSPWSPNESSAHAAQSIRYRSGIRTAAALILAIVVFLVDLTGTFVTAVTSLYAAVLVLGGVRRSTAAIAGWMLFCILMAVIAFEAAKGSSATPEDELRLVLSFIPLFMTGALLRTQNSLTSARDIIRDSQKHLQLTTDLVPQLLWQCAPDGKILFLNRRWAFVTGVSVQAALDAGEWERHLHPQDLEIFFGEWAEAAGDGRALSVDARLRSLNGDFRWMHFAARPLKSESTGTILRWYGSAVDIDDAVKAGESASQANTQLEQCVEQSLRELVLTENRYRLIFEQAHVALFEQDFTGVFDMLEDLRQEGVTDVLSHIVQNPAFLERCGQRIHTVDANRATVRMLGGSKTADVLGPSGRFVDPADAALPAFIKAMFEQRTAIEGRMNLVGLDGRRIVALVGARFPAEREALRRVVVGMLDVTSWERSQEALRRSQQDLARTGRVAALGAVSASIAHDLSQPLGSVLVDAQTALRWLRRDAPDQALAERALDRVVRNAERARAIVDRTREKLVNGSRSVTSFDVGNLVRETANLLSRDQATARPCISVEIDGSFEVQADRSEVQQVLVNLVQNALQASAATGGEVAVRAFGSPPGQVSVTVSDRGVGIAEDDLSRIFEPFFSTKTDGMGMGLAICRATIEGLGGVLAAENRPDGGAVFRFNLPTQSRE